MAVKPSVAAPKKAWSEWWESQPAGRRKQIMLFAGLGTVFIFAFALISGTDASGEKTAKGKIENALLPADAARDLGVNGITNDVRNERERNRKLEGEVARLQQQVERFTNANGEGAASQNERVQSELADIRTQLEQIKSAPQPVNAGGVGPAGQGGPVPGMDVAPAPPPPPAYGPIRTIGGEDSGGGGSSSGAGGVNTPARQSAIRGAAAPAPIPQFYLPSGSIIQGVLLTGVDAPTGRAAMKDPIPVLARIKREAILPNRYLADVRECFLLLDAVGDLASERAMMRSSNISCIRKDRQVIDVPIQGYVVGEDGRAGLRGLLVSKQGVALRKAMLAGFADGVSRAFGGNNNPLSQGNDVDYAQSVQSGALGGASSAMDRIAQYYLDLANELHPIIEIDSGRKVSLVIVRGRNLASIDPAAPAQTNTPPPRPTPAGASQ